MQTIEIARTTHILCHVKPPEQGFTKQCAPGHYDERNTQGIRAFRILIRESETKDSPIALREPEQISAQQQPF